MRLKPPAVKKLVPPTGWSTPDGQPEWEPRTGVERVGASEQNASVASTRREKEGGGAGR